MPPTSASEVDRPLQREVANDRHQLTFKGNSRTTAPSLKPALTREVEGQLVSVVWKSQSWSEVVMRHARNSPAADPRTD